MAGGCSAVHKGDEGRLRGMVSCMREEGRKPGGWCRYKLGPLGCVVPSVLAPRFPQWVALQPRHQEMPTARRGCGVVQRSASGKARAGVGSGVGVGGSESE
jgi:hypothetical protein